MSFLLATGKADPDSKCNRRRTPLSWAASNGVADTVRVLLETGRVDPNSMDEDGRTPLSFAAGSSNYFIAVPRSIREIEQYLQTSSRKTRFGIRSEY